MAGVAGPSGQNLDPAYLQAKEKFMDFLKQDEDEGIYARKVQLMLENDGRRLVVSIDHLRDFDMRLANRLLEEPTQVLPAMEAGLREYVDNMPVDPLQKVQPLQPEEQLNIAVEGAFRDHLVTPRQLGAKFLKKLVCLEGIVTRSSVVRPKVVLSKHWCPATNKSYERKYHDHTSLDGEPTTSLYPVADAEGNLLSTEYGLSTYKDHQLVVIQEMPERAPAGQLPVSVDVLLDNDLVDSVKAGDRLHVVGLFRPIAGKGPFYRTVLLANHVRMIDRDSHSPQITAKDIKTIKGLAEDPEIFLKLANSVAPSIYGHLPIKKAILLMLMGGVEKNLANGTHLRGDINMLMIGDPSTAKSQLLRFVLNIAPLAINTTGRGSSGVGLTAAVTSDKETGERMLEAGACVLADRGIVCIDEFDKMSEDDRVAIHEVMEQQTVTVSKAGIHTTLNARCSVLAAANPVYGQYNRQKKPTENIGLPDSLLSRFDLLFIVLDNFNPVHDRTISEHVLRMHRYRPSGIDHSALGPQTAAEAALYNSYDDRDQEEEVPVYVQINRLLHGDKRDGEIFSIPFLKKYLSYAKHKVAPKLSAEAASFISKAYSDLRCKEDLKTLPVTARTLETMIRLASAHAKCRLSKTTTEDDARVALGIMNFALYHEAEPETSTSHAAVPQQDENDEQDANRQGRVTRAPFPSRKGKRKRDADDDGMPPAKRRMKQPVEEEEDDGEEAEEAEAFGSERDADGDEDMAEAGGDLESTAAAAQGEAEAEAEAEEEEEVELDPERTEIFGKWLVVFMSKKQVEQCSIIDIMDEVNQEDGAKASGGDFSMAEVELILRHMEAEEHILFRKGTVHVF